jgi:hypothetical protein
MMFSTRDPKFAMISIGGSKPDACAFPRRLLVF